MENKFPLSGTDTRTPAQKKRDNDATMDLEMALTQRKTLFDRQVDAINQTSLASQLPALDAMQTTGKTLDQLPSRPIRIIGRLPLTGDFTGLDVTSI